MVFCGVSCGGHGRGNFLGLLSSSLYPPRTHKPIVRRPKRGYPIPLSRIAAQLELHQLHQLHLRHFAAPSHQRSIDPPPKSRMPTFTSKKYLPASAANTVGSRYREHLHSPYAIALGKKEKKKRKKLTMATPQVPV